MPLLQIILVLVVVGVGLYLLSMVPMDATMQQIIRVVVILLVVLWIVSVLFGVHLPSMRT